jgi:hypothetical protein
MLSGDAGVLDRHIPATKIAHLGAELAVDTIKRGLAQGGRGEGTSGHEGSFTGKIAYLSR